MRFTVSMLAATLAVQPMTAFAQDDDWEFQQDAGRKLTVAAVRYDDGKAIIARCQDGDLKLVVVGLPQMTEPVVYLEGRRPDGRQDTQVWNPQSGEGVAALSSGVPARDIRFLRGGGAWGIRTLPDAPRAMRATLDLPSQSANLDRVLVECQRSLQDDRDTLPRARFRAAEAAAQPDTKPRRPVRRGQVVGVAEISCIIRDLRYTDCRADYERPEGAAEDALRYQNRRRLEGEDRSALEGTVAYVSTVTEQSVRIGP